MMTADVAFGLIDVACLRHDLEVALTVEQQAQPAAHHRVIVGEHDPDPRTGCSTRSLTVSERMRIPVGHLLTVARCIGA